MQSPALGKVPGQTGKDPDLNIKATHTGITLLGYFDDKHKYQPTGRFKKRYTGSKQSAVDINGNLWLNANELDKVVKGDVRDKGKGKKKGGKPSPLMSFYYDSPVVIDSSETAAISEENTEPTNNAINIAKKVRKNSYSVNKREVNQRIYGYLNTQRGRNQLYFWTVSFPEGTPDDTCYKIFNVWLTMLRKFRMLRDYLWVAERQDGKRAPGKEPTHTIHFHIAIPHFMNVVKANNMMKGTLKTYAAKGLLPGAIQDMKTKQIMYLPCIAKYNGVDISKHRTTRKPINFAIKKGARALASYLTKYVTKNNAGIPNEQGVIEVPGFEHLAWHNSRGFSALFTGVTFTLSEFQRAGHGHFINRVRIFKMRYAVFIPWLYGPPPKILEHLYELNSYIQNSANVRQ